MSYTSLDDIGDAGTAVGIQTMEEYASSVSESDGAPRTPQDDIGDAGTAVGIQSMEEYASSVSESDGAHLETGAAEMDDSIEFGAGVVDVSQIVQFEAGGEKDDAGETAAKEQTASDDDILKPISHQRESTLLVDSPQLQLIEELDGERKRPEQHHGLIIGAIVLIILGAVVISIALLGRDAVEEEPVSGQVQVAKEQVEERIEKDYVFVPYEIDVMDPDILINGVPANLMEEKAETGAIPILRGENNMLTFSAKGRVPHSVIVAKAHDFGENPLNYTLYDSDNYLKSVMTIRAPKNADLGRAVYYVNGRMTHPEKETVVDCVSGMPYFIHVRQDGMRDHLEIVWPTRNEETVVLPDLLPGTGSERTTDFNLDVPRDYVNDPGKTFHMNVLAEGKYTDSPGTRIVPRGELVQFSLTKSGRYPLKMVIDTTPFGSVRVKAYMQISSIGASTLSFDKMSSKDLTVCFRRTSEALCTEPGAPVTVPSGRWEVAAYRVVDGEKKWFDNAPYETFKAGQGYTLSVRMSEGNKFKLNIKQDGSRKP